MKKCKILGVDIDVTNMNEVVNYIKSNLKVIRGKYICVSNVHTTVMSYEDEYYRQIQNNASLVLPDGKPLSIVSRMRGFIDAKRVTGPDLMEEIFKISEQKAYTHFFYGSTEEVLSSLKTKLISKYPTLNIKGMYSPPFRELSEKENFEVTKMINEANAEFLWVGLGAPKQEIWMYEHRNKINSLMIGIGAGFDYHAGKIKRAPKWMQKLSLEWVYRLLQDPKRLFKRYLITNTKFLYYIFANNIKL